jgi:hypothetical protein
MALLLSAVRFNAILSFGKRTESHGSKFAASVGRGTILVLLFSQWFMRKTGQAQGVILTATRCMLCCLS